MPSVCVIYGIAEGRHVGVNFEKLLKQAGYSLQDDPKVAEIIIAHSGGCYLIPENNRANCVLLIDMPFWPRKSLFSSFVQKFFRDLKFSFKFRYKRWYIYKTFWNLLYGLNIFRGVRMYRGKKQNKPWGIKVPKLIVVRNENDTFCMPDLDQLPFVYKPQLVDLPGEHDDCWVNPERYLELIKLGS